MRDALIDAARLGALLAPLGLATLAIAQTGGAPLTVGDPPAHQVAADGAPTAGRPGVFEIDPALLLPGLNLLAIRAHERAIDGYDFTLSATLESNLVTFIEDGDLWYYRAGVEGPDAGWNELSFDHSEWDIGLSGFGLGDDQQTEPPAMVGRHPTLYLAKAFEATEPSRIDWLTLAVDHDDGFVAFLNGNLVAQTDVGGIDPGTGGPLIDLPLPPPAAPRSEVAVGGRSPAPLVLRGSRVAALGEPGVAVPGAGVRVLRGSAIAPKGASAAGVTQRRLQVVGGRRIWTIDPVTKAVRSCAVRKTSTVGVREVRCTSGSIGRYRRGFGRSFKH